MMKILDKTDETVTIEMTHRQALMIVALIRETCFSPPIYEFTTRVGYTQETVGAVGTELKALLDEVDVTE